MIKPTLTPSGQHNDQRVKDRADEVKDFGLAFVQGAMSNEDGAGCHRY